jgi:transcriptional regulator with XRE-family HTH domain
MAKRRRYNRTTILDVARERGISGYELAPLLGYSRPYLYQVTGGRVAITDEFVRAACDLFGLPAERLFSWSDEVNETTKRQIDDARRKLLTGKEVAGVA